LDLQAVALSFLPCFLPASLAAAVGAGARLIEKCVRSWLPYNQLITVWTWTWALHVEPCLGVGRTQTSWEMGWRHGRCLSCLRYPATMDWGKPHSTSYNVHFIRESSPGSRADARASQQVFSYGLLCFCVLFVRGLCRTQTRANTQCKAHVDLCSTNMSSFQRGGASFFFLLAIRGLLDRD